MASIKKDKLKNGTIVYRINVKYYDKITGLQKLKSTTCIPPQNLSPLKMDAFVEKEAEEFEKSIRNIVNSNKPNATNYHNSNFKEFALMWINTSKKEKGVTYYEDNIRQVNYLIKELGHYKLKEITPAIIQELYDRIDSRKREIITVVAQPNFNDVIYAYGWTRTKIKDTIKEYNTYRTAFEGRNVNESNARKLSKSLGIPFELLFKEEIKVVNYANQTNLSYKKTLRQILSKAVKYGIVDRNYASSEFIDFPKAKKPKIDVMNDDEIKRFFDTLNNLESVKIKTALYLSILTGFRRGEVVGLRWSDIDFNKKTITINRSIRQSKELGYFVKDPKTESSNRTITIPNILIDQLLKYKEWQEEQTKDFGDSFNPEHYVFTDSFGNSIRLDMLGTWMKRVLEKAEMTHHTLHSLRHTNIAIQIAAGVPIVTVASRAGHARTSTTTDIYAYSLIGTDKMAANVLDDAFSDNDRNALEKANQVSEFKKIKEEIKSLGLNSLEEYYEYKKYIEMKNNNLL